MKYFIDGDQICVTRDDFIDLQQSPAVFLPKDSQDGKAILRDGILALPFGKLMDITAELNRQRSASERGRSDLAKPADVPVDQSRGR